MSAIVRVSGACVVKKKKTKSNVWKEFGTDNGSNVVVAFRNIAILRVSYFGHNLDLAIKKVLSFPHVQHALARCHSLVELFHHSWIKARNLQQKLEELDLPQH